MDHAQFTHLLKGIGVEIGAHNRPLPGINPIYIDKYPEFAGTPCLMDCYGTLESLPILDASLDYIVASHVLEHSANPIKGLVEMHRVMRHGGILYLVLPNKNKTWDRNRKTTPVDHFFEDYERETTDCDATHINDFIFNVVWEEISPDTAADKIEETRVIHARHYEDQVAEGSEINIHFHTFDPVNLRAMIEALNQRPIPCAFDILDFQTDFPDSNPDGILTILKKTTRTPAATACRRSLQRRLSSHYPFTPEAKRVDRPPLPSDQ